MDYVHNNISEIKRKAIYAGLGVALTVGMFNLSNCLSVYFIGKDKQIVERSLHNSKSISEKVLEKFFEVGKPGREVGYYLRRRK